jgi:hypothetical protein
MFTYSDFNHGKTTQNALEESLLVAPISSDYRVYAKGEEIPVYSCRISSYPFNIWWMGRQRPLEQSESASYINLIGDEEITLTIEAKKPHSRVLVKPYNKGILANEENGIISVTLKTTGQYVLELDDYHGLLYIFYSKPIECKKPEEITHYFGPGIHYPRQIQLKSGDKVYIDKDALVYGCFLAHDCCDIEIFGNGILDDSGEERFAAPCYTDFTVGNIKFYDCKNLTIRGVGMTNSAIWCLNLFHCFNVEVDDIKIFGQWRYNTDGIDIVNSQNIFIRNSFIHSFDDTITIKGILRYCQTPNKNIHTENCILWCDWGKTCELGIETACLEYENISFSNCDLLRAGNTACDIANGYTAFVHNIRFENIRIEMNAFDTAEELQFSYESNYTKQNTPSIPAILRIINFPYEGTTNSYSIRSGDQTSERTAWVSDILCRQITVYYDDGLPKNDGNPILNIHLENTRPGAEYENIRIENITCMPVPCAENTSPVATPVPFEGITWHIKNLREDAFTFSKS